MSDIMRPMSIGHLMNWALSEYKKKGSIFGIDKLVHYTSGQALPIYEEKIESPFGPAAGPNTQLAQNIIASYVAGSRFFELKTVQVMDGAVPAKERHQSARFNTEQSYTDWQLTLAREQLEKCQKNIEYWQKQAATELDNLTFEQYQSEKWTKRQRELHKRFEELSEEYLQQNLIWYEKYQEYEEAFSDYLE